MCGGKAMATTSRVRGTRDEILVKRARLGRSSSSTTTATSGVMCRCWADKLTEKSERRFNCIIYLSQYIDMCGDIYTGRVACSRR